MGLKEKKQTQMKALKTILKKELTCTFYFLAICNHLVDLKYLVCVKVV